MPTYEYFCTGCGKNFDAFQGIKSKPRAKCPVCGKYSTTRLIGAGGGVIFKGSGFYCNDYGRDVNRKKED